MQTNIAGKNKAIIHYVDHAKLIASQGEVLLKSTDSGCSWKYIGAIYLSYRNHLIYRFRLLRRLLRKGIHHILVSDNCSVIFADHDTYLLLNGIVNNLGKINGSRPLAVCQRNNSFYYGEYRSNPERSPVHIWKWGAGSVSWFPVWEFYNIRHVHGVFNDPYSTAIWVTTGDEDHEAGIWRTDDDFASLHKIAGGSQQVRAIQLLFTNDFVYFGSDAPNEKNFLYRMDREGKGIEQLTSVSGSIFYGCKVGNMLFFSTAVEPSGINTCRYSELLRSDDGTHWEVIFRAKKDLLPIKYFQYGQIKFPSGIGDDKNLWFTPMSTEYDQQSIRLKLN